MPNTAKSRTSYTVRGNGPLAERYKNFRKAQQELVVDIETRDKKLAASARQLLSVPANEATPHEAQLES